MSRAVLVSLLRRVSLRRSGGDSPVTPTSSSSPFPDLKPTNTYSGTPGSPRTSINDPRIRTVLRQPKSSKLRSDSTPGNRKRTDTGAVDTRFLERPQKPDFDRTVDLEASVGYNVDKETVFAQLLLKSHGAEPTSPKDTNKQNLWACLPFAVRRQIISYLLPVEPQSVTLSPYFATKYAYHKEYFANPWDVLEPVMDHLASFHALREDVLTYFWSHFRFHVTLSHVTGPAFSPLSQVWLLKYLDRVQHLTIELDITRFDGSEFAEASLVKYDMEKMEKRTTDIVIGLSKRRGTTIMAELNIMCRRYSGYRPVEDLKKSGYEDPAAVPYCPDETMLFCDVFGRLRGLLLYCRIAGFSNDYTETMLGILFENGVDEVRIEQPREPGWPEVPTIPPDHIIASISTSQPSTHQPSFLEPISEHGVSHPPTSITSCETAASHARTRTISSAKTVESSNDGELQKCPPSLPSDAAKSWDEFRKGGLHLRSSLRQANTEQKPSPTPLQEAENIRGEVEILHPETMALCNLKPDSKLPEELQPVHNEGNFAATYQALLPSMERFSEDSLAVDEPNGETKVKPGSSCPDTIRSAHDSDDDDVCAFDPTFEFPDDNPMEHKSEDDNVYTFQPPKVETPYIEQIISGTPTKYEDKRPSFVPGNFDEPLISLDISEHNSYNFQPEVGYQDQMARESDNIVYTSPTGLEYHSQTPMPMPHSNNLYDSPTGAHHQEHASSMSQLPEDNMYTSPTGLQYHAQVGMLEPPQGRQRIASHETRNVPRSPHSMNRLNEQDPAFLKTLEALRSNAAPRQVSSAIEKPLTLLNSANVDRFEGDRSTTSMDGRKQSESLKGTESGGKRRYLKFINRLKGRSEASS